MSYLGEAAAVATAVSWALSGMAFAITTRAVGGFATNHFRIWLALPMLAVLVWLVEGRLIPRGLDAERGGLLVVSGWIGMVLGDIGYFHALAAIGPRLASVIMASWPIAVVFGGPVGGDELRFDSLPGVAVTVFGVVIVLWCARRGSSWNPGITRGQWWLGVGGAVLASVGQALGILLSRRGMAPSEVLPGGIAPLGASLVRVTAGVVGMQVFAFARRRPLAGLEVCASRRPLVAAVLATAVGPVLGVWMSMVAAHRCVDVGAGAALMATAPLFMLPLSWFAYGSRPGVIAIFGTALTVVGAAWLVMAQDG